MPVPPARRLGALVLWSALLAPPAAAQMTVEEYQPRSSLRVPEHRLTRARYPFIDIHAHEFNPTPGRAAGLVRDMDAMNMAIMVNLSGGSGDALVERLAALRSAGPSRFAAFANVDFSRVGEPGFGQAAADQLARDVANGAVGLKIFKDLGMDVRDGAGLRVPTDDPRLAPIWDRAGALGIPVLIHTGDPAPFWDPKDAFNERWYELEERPGRIRPPDRYPPWEVIMGEQWNLFRKHPKTTFIAAHLSWLGGDLGRLGRLLDSLPNMYVELGAVLAEIGRQPRHAREFFIRYQDRILMGKDAWEPSEYFVYFRVLETEDEYFEYYRRRHAFWRMYGLSLPDQVLRKLYYGNALRIVPGLDASLFPGN